MLPTFGTPHLPVPAGQEVRGSLAPRLRFRVSLGRKPKKTLCEMSSLGRVLRLFSATHPCSPGGRCPFNSSCRFQTFTTPRTFLSREEGSCTLQTANLPLKERICSRRSDRPSPPLAELHPSCPPGFSARNGSFPKGRHEALFPSEPRPRGSEATGTS